MARGSWRITVRQGPDVEKLSFASLDQALGATRERIERVRREGGLPPINALRDFPPGQRVHARIELVGPRRMRPPRAGIDVMGDGSIVAYRGTLSKEPLGADSLEQALDRVGEALGG